MLYSCQSFCQGTYLLSIETIVRTQLCLKEVLMLLFQIQMATLGLGSEPLE